MPILGARGTATILGFLEALRRGAGESAALPRDHHLGVLVADSRAHRPCWLHTNLGRVRQAQLRSACLERRRADHPLPPGDARLRPRPSHLRSARSGPMISFAARSLWSWNFLTPETKT